MGPIVFINNCLSEVMQYSVAGDSTLPGGKRKHSDSPVKQQSTAGTPTGKRVVDLKKCSMWISHLDNCYFEI